jgi:vacuolar-type H+-ATPase subunit E/Vma4
VMLEVDMNRKRAVTKLDKESAKKLKEKEKKAKKTEEIIISNVTITMNRMLSEVVIRSKFMINTTT